MIKPFTVFERSQNEKTAIGTLHNFSAVFWGGQSSNYTDNLSLLLSLSFPYQAEHKMYFNQNIIVINNRWSTRPYFSYSNNECLFFTWSNLMLFLFCGRGHEVVDASVWIGRWVKLWFTRNIFLHKNKIRLQQQFIDKIAYEFFTLLLRQWVAITRD